MLPTCLISGTSFKAEWYAYDISPLLAFLFQSKNPLTGMLARADKLRTHSHHMRVTYFGPRWLVLKLVFKVFENVVHNEGRNHVPK